VYVPGPISQVFRQSVRPAGGRTQFSLSPAAVEVAAGGRAETGGRPRAAGEGGELVEVRLPQLDLGQPDGTWGVVLDDPLSPE
jgi:hypothetical protein